MSELELNLNGPMELGPQGKELRHTIFDHLKISVNNSNARIAFTAGQELERDRVIAYLTKIALHASKERKLLLGAILEEIQAGKHREECEK